MIIINPDIKIKWRKEYKVNFKKTKKVDKTVETTKIREWRA